MTLVPSDTPKKTCGFSRDSLPMFRFFPRILRVKSPNRRYFGGPPKTPQIHGVFSDEKIHLEVFQAERKSNARLF